LGRAALADDRTICRQWADIVPASGDMRGVNGRETYDACSNCLSFSCCQSGPLQLCSIVTNTMAVGPKVGVAWWLLAKLLSVRRTLRAH